MADEYGGYPGAIDRWGAKPVMIAGAMLATASGVLAALAPHFFLIIIAQFIWGVGTSIWMFGREIAAFDMVKSDQRGRQMSALMGIGSTGMALGPAVGGIVTDIIGIRALFWLYAGTSGVVLFISSIQANAHRDPPTKREKTPFVSLNVLKKIHPYYRITYAVLFFATARPMR